MGALGDVTGLDVLELGCGTAYVSAWLAGAGPARRRRPDPAQLATARVPTTFGLRFPLIEADAEHVPLRRTFDLVVSEYGASLWCDLERWVPEAARLLRPGGPARLPDQQRVAALCVPEAGGLRQVQLQRPQRGLGRRAGRAAEPSSTRATATGSASCERAGSSVEALHELYAPDEPTTHEYYEIAMAEWARSGPSRTSGRPETPAVSAPTSLTVRCSPRGLALEGRGDRSAGVEELQRFARDRERLRRLERGQVVVLLCLQHGIGTRPRRRRERSERDHVSVHRVRRAERVAARVAGDIPDSNTAVRVEPDATDSTAFPE